MRTAALVLAGLLSATGAGAGDKAPKAPIRVFVFTANPPGGFVDKDLEHRQDSVKDLTESLRKKEGVVVATAAEGADIAVEIAGRGHEETGGVTISHGKASKDRMPTLHARLIAGEYTADFDAQFTDADAQMLKMHPWRTVSGRIAKQVEQWIDMNRAHVLELRDKAPAAQ